MKGQLGIGSRVLKKVRVSRGHASRTPPPPPQLLSNASSPVCEAKKVSRLTSVFQLILAATVFSHKALSSIKTKPKYRNKVDSIHVKHSHQIHPLHSRRPREHPEFLRVWKWLGPGWPPPMAGAPIGTQRPTSLRQPWAPGFPAGRR